MGACEEHKGWGCLQIMLVLPPLCHPPQLLGSARTDESMLFLVVFMGRPGHVKSSHLRSKMAEVLHAWLPMVRGGKGGGMPGYPW